MGPLLLAYTLSTLLFGHIGGASSEKSENDWIKVMVYNITLDNTQHKVSIKSPGFPYRNYPANTQIEYNIQAHPKREVDRLSTRIIVYFDVFVLEDSAFCHKDGLEIIDVGTRQMRVYCGGSHSGRTVLSDGGALRMRFFTDKFQEERGFKLTFELLRSDCSAEYKGVGNVEVASPYHPTPYRKDDLCVWKFKAPKNHVLRATFEGKFDVRGKPPLCAQDYISISLSGDLHRDSNRFCGRERPHPLQTESDTLMVMFRSDCCFQGSGFLLRVISVSAPTTTPSPITIPDTSCSCGIENIKEKRIVGGEIVDPPHRYPWMVAILDSENNKVDDVDCGGALINRQFILTAAHCVQGKEVSRLSAVLGGHEMETNATPPAIPIAEVRAHEDYDPTTYANDIAVLRLASPVTISTEKGIAPVCLPPRSYQRVGDDGLVAGWGWLNEVGESNTVLRSVELPIVSNAECSQRYGAIVLETNLCAGTKGKDSCKGDSGGPMVQKVEDRWTAVGIVSFGIGCGREGYPGVYTRVASYLDWIRDNAQPAPPCPGDIPSPLQPNRPDCGVSGAPRSKRVVGGTETTPMKYPWLALITYQKKIRAHGALVSPQYVLTAASALKDWFSDSPKNLVIFLGQHDLLKKEPYAKSFRGLRVVYHPRYNKPRPYDNDLALIQLSSPASPVLYPPICLPPFKAQYQADTPAVVVGWGRTGNGKAGTTTPREAHLTITGARECANTYPGLVTATMMCAGGKGKDACDRDWGTPLMYEYRQRYYAAGIFIANSNEGCGVQGQPSIFSAVHANRQWIETETNSA